MPFVVDILRDPELARCRLSGAVIAADLNGAFEAVIRHSDDGPVTAVWWDARQAEPGELDFDAMQAFASRTMKHVADEAVRAAIIVDDPLSYGLARMYQELTDGSALNVEIFDASDVANSPNAATAATRWLGLAAMPPQILSDGRPDAG